MQHPDGKNGALLIVCYRTKVLRLLAFLPLLVTPFVARAQVAHAQNDVLYRVEHNLRVFSQDAWKFLEEHRPRDEDYVPPPPPPPTEYLPISGPPALRFDAPEPVFDRARLYRLPEAEELPEFPSDPAGLEELLMENKDEEDADKAKAGKEGEGSDKEKTAADGRSPDGYYTNDRYLPFTLRPPPLPDRFVNPEDFLLYFQTEDKGDGEAKVAVPFYLPNVPEAPKPQSKAEYQQTE